jgi:hypothetical protein
MTSFPVTDNRRYLGNKFFEKLPVTDPIKALAAAAEPVQKYNPAAPEYKPPAPVAKQEIPFELTPLKLYWGEYVQRHAVHADMAGWLKEFKKLLPQVPGVEQSTAFTVGGTVVATYHRDAQLNFKRLSAEQPEIVAKYTRPMTEMKFDEDAFANDMPDVHAAYRGKQLRLVRRSGVTLAHLVQ